MALLLGFLFFIYIFNIKHILQRSMYVFKKLEKRYLFPNPFAILPDALKNVKNTRLSQTLNTKS